MAKERALKEFAPYQGRYTYYERVSSPTAVRALVDRLLEEKPAYVAVDTETHYVPLRKAPQAITVWIKGSKNNAPFGVSLFYIDAKGEKHGYWVDNNLQLLAPFLTYPGIAKVFHNAKYDLQMLKNISLEVEGRIYDTMIMIQLIDEELECNMPRGRKRRSRKLKDLAFHFLGHDAHDLEDAVREARHVIAFNKRGKVSEVSYKDVQDVLPDLMRDYAIADTEYTYLLFEIFGKEIQAQNLQNPYNVDINATMAIIDIERAGVLVDQEAMAEDDKALTSLIEALHARAGAIVGRTYNPNADAELVEAFATLGVTWRWYTDKGNYATDKKIMKNLIADNQGTAVADLAETILQYRKANKLLSTYVKGIRDYIQEDGRIHCTYWVTGDDKDDKKQGTKTGRLASSNPNMQNIPKKPITLTVLGKEYVFRPRRYFVADPGYVMVFMDADQEEYRLLAHYGNDSAFREMVHKGWDIHKGAATMIFDVAYEDVTEDQRNTAKTINFALVYGLGTAAFANALGYRIDEDLLRAGTRWLYKQRQAFEYPPYNEGITLANVYEGLSAEDMPDDETMQGVAYFFSEAVQEGLRVASTKKRDYFAKFPGIKQFVKKASQVAASRGYVIMWDGRRRHFKNPEKDAYKAPNSIIQGGCGGILKSKLAQSKEMLGAFKSFMFNNVHDEIGYMVKIEELYIVLALREMLQDLPFSVPVTWGLEWGFDWGHKHEVNSWEEIAEQALA